MAIVKEYRRFNYQDCKEGQIHYWTAGTGPDLLLLHSSGNSAEEFGAIVPFLVDHFRMIAIDLPGHGRTYNSDTQLEVEDFADAVRVVLDALNIDKMHVVGQHGGALCAMSLMATEPDRFEKAIFSGVDDGYDPVAKEALIERVKSTDIEISSDSKIMSATWERYIGMLSDGGTPKQMLRPFIAFLDARLRPSRGILTNLMWDRRDAVSKLRGPVLIIAGDKDSFVEKQENLIALIPNSEFLEMKGAGTFMFYDFPKESAEMIKQYLK